MNEWLHTINEIFRKMLFLPEQSSTLAWKIDRLHYVVFVITMLSAVLVGGVATLFLFKFRETKKNATTAHVSPSLKFEAAVVAVPLVIFLAWVVVGFKDYVWATQPPKGATDVYVTAKKWMWHFAYPDGPNMNATLTVPANRPVRLLMTSRDVIHSFFVPEFRVKMDVVPGRYSETWFEATKPGRYRIYCTEYCGTWHSQMVGEVVVLAGPEFDKWMERAKQGTDRVDVSGGAEFGVESFRGDLVTHGRRLASVHGCLKCHTVTPEPHIGTTWVDLYKRKTPLETGAIVVADEAYLTESMMDPFAKVVKGYKQVMPSFRGKLSAPETAAIVEFIKSLRSDNLENLPSKEPTYGPVNAR